MRYPPAMNSLEEIEQAAYRLSSEEQFELVFRISNRLEKTQEIPKPREFSDEQIREWLEEDERQGREIREMLGIETTP